MEVEEGGLLGPDVDLPDDLWHLLDSDLPDADQIGFVPGSELEAYDWEKLLDNDEIQNTWPEGFVAGPPIAPAGVTETLPVSIEVPLVRKAAPCNTQGGARTSQTSSSVSLLTLERQLEEPKGEGCGSQDSGRSKRARSEDVEGSSEGDANSPGDSKRQARLVRNRESASQSRERKKQRMQDMEQRCASLEEQVKSMSRAVTATALENAALREELQRVQAFRYPPSAMPATGRAGARGAKKGTGTEPAVLSSDSLPRSSLFHRPTLPPSPIAPLQQPPQLRLLASGPFLLFVLLRACLVSEADSARSPQGSPPRFRSSWSVSTLRSASLVRRHTLRKQRRGRRRAKRRSAWSGRLKEGVKTMRKSCKIFEFRVGQ